MSFFLKVFAIAACKLTSKYNFLAISRAFSWRGGKGRRRLPHLMWPKAFGPLQVAKGRKSTHGV
jgi:hypothetical protein